MNAFAAVAICLAFMLTAGNSGVITQSPYAGRGRGVGRSVRPSPIADNVTIDWKRPAKSVPYNGDPTFHMGNVYRTSVARWVMNRQYAYIPSPPCAGNIDAARDNVANGIKGGAMLVGSFFPPWGAWIGTIAGSAIVAVGQASPGSDLHKFITGGQSFSNCDVVGIVIPGAAKLTDVTYWVSSIDRKRVYETAAGREEWWCTFDGPYQVTRIVRDKDKAELQLVSAVFKNWSADHPRLAGLVIAYELPEKP